MKKSLLRVSFIFIALVLSSKAAVTLFGYQAAEAARDAYGQKVSISYGWISSSFDGSLTFKDVVLTPYALKRPFFIPELRLEYGGYFSLIKGLVELKSLSVKGLEKVHINKIRAPLEGRDLEVLLASEHAPEIALPLALYGCAETKRVGHQELKEMGILEQRADVIIEFPQSPEALPGTIKLNADLYELGRLSLHLSLPTGINDSGWTQSDIQDVSVSYADNGYFRRVANFCELRTGLARKAFAQTAALAWQKSLKNSGIAVSDALVNAYYTFMSLGGQVKASMIEEKAKSPSEMLTQFDENLFDELGMSLSINNASVAGAKLVLESAHFRPTVKVADVKPEQPVVEQRFIPLELADLDKSLGKQLRVVLSSGKSYEGTLQASDEFYFELVPAAGGGNVTYNVQREEVAELFVLSAAL
jgi:hypothetical protein